MRISDWSSDVCSSDLADAMTLGNRDARTIVTLALVKVGLGKDRAARDLLASHADIVPAADYGLALAMAGDAPEGVRILSEMIHDPAATARTRQNLAARQSTRLNSRP